MDEKMKGPLLPEADFYALLDKSVPELAAVSEAAKNGDLDEAKQLFARHIREGGYADRYFNNRKSISSSSSAPTKEQLVKSCEKILAHELSSVGVSHKFEGSVDWFYNATYNGYKEWTWQLSRHYSIPTLSQAYEVTGDEKYAECAVELITSWIRQAVRPEADVRDGDTLCWRTIECGIRMTRWPDIFFPILKSKAVTDTFILDFCRSLYEHGERLIRSKTGNNWRNIELGGFSTLCAFFPIFEVSAAWREHVANGVYEQLIRQVHPDGCQFELAPGYHSVVINESLHGAKMLGLSGHVMPEKFNSTITKMYEMFALLVQSGNHIPGINDHSGGTIDHYMPKDGDFRESALIKWAKSGCGDLFAPQRDTLVLFENAGLVTMRDKWANSKTSVFFDAGKFGRSHQHEDKLNVLAYSNGKEILTEGHSYAYDTSDMRSYVLSTYSHNTVTVDGLCQNRRGTYKWEDEMLRSREDVKTYSSDTLDYAMGEYREAYGMDAAVTDVVHKREVALVKKPKVGSGTVIIIDTLCGEYGHTYEALWHLDIDAIKIDGDRAVSDEVSIAFGEDIGTLSVIKGQTEPHVQGFVCRSTIQGDYDPIPTVINSIKAKNARSLTVFSFGAALASVSLDGKNVNLSYQNGEQETVRLPS